MELLPYFQSTVDHSNTMLLRATNEQQRDFVKQNIERAIAENNILVQHVNIPVKIVEHSFFKKLPVGSTFRVVEITSYHCVICLGIKGKKQYKLPIRMVVEYIQKYLNSL